MKDKGLTLYVQIATVVIAGRLIRIDFGTMENCPDVYSIFKNVSISH